MRFAVLLMCAALSAQTGADPYSVEKEQALGAQIAAEYRRQTPVLDAPSVNAYLDELGRRLAAHAPATGFTYTFELVDDAQTWLHEPAAFPGGPVFVPAALVLAAADESELAAMLAHAIAHIVTRRMTRQAAPGPVSYTAVPLILMGGWAGYAVGKPGNTVPVAFLAVQRKSELDSDRVAAGILSAAGFDPGSLARYIARVQPAGPARPNPMAPYPDKAARLAVLEEATRQLPPGPYPAHPGLDAIQQEVGRISPHPAKSPPRLAR